MDLTQSVNGVTLTKSFKVREDEDSPKSDSKTIHLKVTFTGTLQGVFWKALVPVVIAVQGKVRKHWSRYTDGQTVEVSFSAPTVQDPKEAMEALIRTMSPQEREKYFLEKFGLKVLPTAPEAEKLS